MAENGDGNLFSFIFIFLFDNPAVEFGGKWESNQTDDEKSRWGFFTKRLCRDARFLRKRNKNRKALTREKDSAFIL